LDEFDHKLAVLDGHCADVRRPRSEIRTQLVLQAVLGADDAEISGQLRDRPDELGVEVDELRERVLAMTPGQLAEHLRPYVDRGVGDFLLLAGRRWTSARSNCSRTRWPRRCAPKRRCVPARETVIGAGSRRARRKLRSDQLEAVQWTASPKSRHQPRVNRLPLVSRWIDAAASIRPYSSDIRLQPSGRRSSEEAAARRRAPYS
jgi:hypothetical protein